IIMRNNEITIDDIKMINPSHIIISPGPCTPSEAGICLDIVRELSGEFPILGVCLGHQSIGQAFGAKIVRADQSHQGDMRGERREVSGDIGRPAGLAQFAAYQRQIALESFRAFRHILSSGRCKTRGHAFAVCILHRRSRLMQLRQLGIKLLLLAVGIPAELP
ncbi:MAG: hypothetical protein EBV03_05945, partial [Proteobacteria bacterium]|nr:hypothetical protein [Pseudomonadota bacterium]